VSGSSVSRVFEEADGKAGGNRRFYLKGFNRRISSVVVITLRRIK